MQSSGVFSRLAEGTLADFMRLAALLLLPPSLAFAAPKTVAFNRDVRPILSSNCFHCHGPDEKKREGGLRLDLQEAAFKGGKSGLAFEPGKPDDSDLLLRVQSHDKDDVMPPPKSGKPLTPAQVETLRRWIAEGAEYEGHWSFTKPVRAKLPANGAAHPIDAFVRDRLAKEKLSPSPEADRGTLVRRVALDLTGLPPSPEEVETFLTDNAIDAYPRMVDRFLAKPAFGEHWARHWLDLARYADSAGYPSDPGREIWAYRDWVIRAFNANEPFDQFTIDQLAGDLLPNPTQDQIIATAFHRNTMTNNEGGTSDEEYRVAAVLDRVNTTMAVWMGLSFNCAQCHSHKFDPFAQKEYYQLMAFFNQSADADLRDESPLLEFATDEQKKQRAALEDQVAKLDEKFGKPAPAWLSGLEKWDTAFPRDFAWQQPRPAKVESTRKAEVTVRDDASVLVAPGQDRDIYKVDLPLSGSHLTAVRLETLPDPSLPGKGPGYGGGNFVISQVKAQVLPAAATPLRGRFVRIELPGKEPLHLAEVQVFQGAENIALKGAANQSSLYGDANATRAIDGNTDGDFFHHSVTHTDVTQDVQWWELDLDTMQAIDRIVVWNRTDGGVGSRLHDFRIVVLDDQHRPIWTRTEKPSPKVSREFKPSDPIEVTFQAALADVTQKNYDAATVLDEKKGKDKGWAISGYTGKPHTLTLLPATPVEIPANATLRFTIEQQSKTANHTLGCFRVGFSNDNRAAQFTRTPTDVLPALVPIAADRTPAQQRAVSDYYVRQVAPEAKTERAQLAKARADLAAFKLTTVPIMRELPANEARVTNVFLRGNWLAHGDQVSPGTPAVFPPLPADVPRNRLAFARWLVSPENPLTARVIANRFWEQIFGLGLVRTSEEFGSQGDLPSHPELLDWLATELQGSGWNVKAFLKLIVTSETYRQSSKVTAELLERDPDNTLLTRGPRFRLPGEVVRDQALAVSGLLSPKMFGAAVRPSRPNLGLSTAFGRSDDWVPSTGEDRYRRAVYTEVRRNSPYPSFSTFDAPNREVCTLRRSRSNTPLQAFVTLNDPAFVEAAQAFARRIVAHGGSGNAERLNFAFHLCVSRAPSEAESNRLLRLLAEAQATYTQDLKAAEKLATDPLGPLPKSGDAIELAAWTTIANVLLNLDETLMRR